MRPFRYETVADPAAATAALAQDPGALLIAGGTEVVNWLKEGIVRPTRLLDVSGLPGLGAIDARPDELAIGALVTMADLADCETVRRDYPAVAEALNRSASQQLRNMATIGGNLLQRTRCPYFRAETDLPCNKRRPGSGCAAIGGADRTLAIFGWSEHCVATHPSDLAVALAALDASVTLRGLGGERTVPVAEFYRLPGDAPERDTVLDRGELITAVTVPASATARNSWYLKVRERVSYEFALVSVAAGVQVDEDGTITDARIALGGVAHGPWRLHEAEAALNGVSIDDTPAIASAVNPAFNQAQPRLQNGFKVPLAQRAVLRTLTTAVGAR
ncbi:MAG: xanthine dehydrogenase family protein subunit M [Nocardiopsaceae bacterium]|nr:xanthine dehydrogenase family protein subunit M [Nocardiopsaceae bacterium]